MLRCHGRLRNPLVLHRLQKSFRPRLADFLGEFQALLCGLRQPFCGLGVLGHAAQLALPKVEIGLCKCVEIRSVGHGVNSSLLYLNVAYESCSINFLLRNKDLC